MGKPAADGPDSWRIGTFEIGESPSPISVVQEHAKAVLALSTGLLGASAAFIERLIGTQPSASQLVWTAIAWAALVVSIAFAVLCNAHLFKYLSWQRNWQRSRKSAALFGALAPWPLLFGAVILAILRAPFFRGKELHGVGNDGFRGKVYLLANGGVGHIRDLGSIGWETITVEPSSAPGVPAPFPRRTRRVPRRSASYSFGPTVPRASSRN